MPFITPFPSCLSGIASDMDTHTYTQPFYGSLDFVWDNLGDLVLEETFTHSYLS